MWESGTCLGEADIGQATVVSEMLKAEPVEKGHIARVCRSSTLEAKQSGTESYPSLESGTKTRVTLPPVHEVRRHE